MKCIDEEIPFEIPQSWCWVRFENLVVHNPQVTADDETNAAFMPMTLIDAGYGSNYTYETKKWGAIKTGFTKIATGDIAYAKITPCFQNRKSFILGEVPGGVAAATTELNVIRTYAGTLDEWYILYFLKSEYFIKEARYKGTAGQQRVLTDYVQSKLVPLPPLNEQKKIVKKIQEALPIVRTYGKSQEALDRLNAEVFDKLKKSVLQEAIQGKLVSQDPNDEPVSVLLERIKEEKAKLFKEGKLKKKELTDSVIFKGEDNKYYEQIGKETTCVDDEIPFDIPNTWSWIRLGHIFQHNTGKALNGSNQRGTPYEYITTSNLYWNQFVLEKLRQMPFTDDELDKCTVKKGDLLVCEGGDIGRSAIWNYDNEIRIQNHIHRLRAYVPVSTMFFYYTLYLYKHVGLIGGKGIGIQGLSSNALHNLLLPLPPVKEQQRISESIANLFSKLS